MASGSTEIAQETSCAAVRMVCFRTTFHVFSSVSRSADALDHSRVSPHRLEEGFSTRHVLASAGDTRNQARCPHGTQICRFPNPWSSSALPGVQSAASLESRRPRGMLTTEAITQNSLLRGHVSLKLESLSYVGQRGLF